MPDMQGFVHRKNGALDSKRSQRNVHHALDEFKMAPQKPGHPVRAIQRNQPVQLAPPAENQSRRSSTGEPPFYGTDASGIDSSTAPGSVTQQAYAIKQEANSQTGQIQDQDENESSDGSYESDSQGEYEEYDEVDRGVNPNGHEPQQVERTITRRVSGDSYPSETSGPPSIVSAHTHTQPHANAAHQRHPLGQNGNPMRNNVERNHTPNSGAQRHVQPFASSNGPMSQHPAIYQRQPETGLTEHVAQAHQKPAIPARQTRAQPVVTITQQHAHKATNLPRHDPHAKHPNEALASQMTSTGGHQRGQAVQSFDAADERQYTEHPIDDRRDHDHSSYHGEEDEEMRYDPLDHDPPQLFEMNLQQLQNEKFDYDPKAEEFILPDGKDADDLQGKLEAVYALDDGEQMRFFASLNITEWEEAGDWFLEKFGEAMGKFKKARQEKRKAALAFEQEIEIRHEAVAKRRKLTEQALNGMKTNGVQVLAGTPKSKKGKN